MGSHVRRRCVQVIPWEEGLDTCPICGEEFDKYWDEDGNLPPPLPSTGTASAVTDRGRVAGKCS